MPKTYTPYGEGAYVTVTSGMSGFFAVHIHLNRIDAPEDAFEEPWDTGLIRSPHIQDAIVEAKAMASEFNLPYKAPKGYENV